MVESLWITNVYFIRHRYNNGDKMWKMCASQLNKNSFNRVYPLKSQPQLIHCTTAYDNFAYFYS